MTTLQSIISLLKRVKYGSYINPARDWLVLVTLSLIAFSSIVVWNMWAFDTVTRGGVIGAVATSSIPLFNRAAIDEINIIFANRATEEEKYETGEYRFADPSR